MPVSSHEDPCFPNVLLKMMGNLLEQHLKHNSEQHKGMSKVNWANGKAMAHSRRCHLCTLIVQQVDHTRGYANRAAQLQAAGGCKAAGW